MSRYQDTPAVSELIRLQESGKGSLTGGVSDGGVGGSSGTGAIKTSREEWKKQRELEEARKAGTAPAEVDESGKDINPHIPQYISSAPWYYNSRGPTLRHQRVQDETQKVYSGLDEWYKKGVDVTKIATKFRKGACENCGAMTHKKKDCVERPRKVLAKFSGEGFAPDEYVQPNLSLDFDGKRDRWNGYDPNEHLAIVEDFQKVEEAKRVLKSEKLKSGQDGEPLPDNMVMELEDGEEDEDKYVDDVDMPGTKMDSKERITVRNLRIREDTAKYLRNLDPNSAFYDPKTRAMRDNPYKGTGRKMEEVDFAGDNFVRFSGDTNKHATAQLFAWEAQEKGVDVHLLAEPTKLEALQKEFVKKKDEFKSSLTQNIIDKYGGEKHLKAPPKTLLMAQTEDYVEYSRQGKILKGGERPTIKSKYEEDIYPNNHCSVYGSYWRAGGWGYHCCHSLIQNSYCTGESGREANDKSQVPEGPSGFGFNSSDATSPNEPKTLVEIHKELKKKADLEEAALETKLSKNQRKNAKRKESKKKKAQLKKKKGKASSSSSSDESSSSSSSGSSDSESDSSAESDDDEDNRKKKLAKALAAEDRRLAEAEGQMDDRKRGYNSRYDIKAPTEMETEAYLLKRPREEDPMLDFMAKKKK